VPELPEVETTRRGIAPRLLGRRILEVRIRDPRLRWPIPFSLAEALPQQSVSAVQRRAKYLLLRLQAGTLILHLGMSGSLRVVAGETPPGPHDHFDLLLDNGDCLRLRDPRRFGAVLWTAAEPEQHPLLAHLGPEPLGPAFGADYLYQCAQRRRTAIKPLLMDQRVVVGVGNIYANEALFSAGIHPQRNCRRIALPRCGILVASIQQILNSAIEQGGTTLRDFQDSDGRPGYFAQELQVYARAGEACLRCGNLILQRRLGQRSSFYCPRCQH